MNRGPGRLPGPFPLMSVMNKGSAGRVEAVKASMSSDPQGAACVLIDASDRIVAQAGGMGRIMAIVREGVGHRVEPVESA